MQRLSEQEASKAGVLQFADAIMESLLAVFGCRNATVHEEAMLAAGALTYACGPQFVKYMERFFPVLEMGLTKHKARSPQAKLLECGVKRLFLDAIIRSGARTTDFIAMDLEGMVPSNRDGPHLPQGKLVGGKSQFVMPHLLVYEAPFRHPMLCIPA